MTVGFFLMIQFISIDLSLSVLINDKCQYHQDCNHLLSKFINCDNKNHCNNSKESTDLQRLQLIRYLIKNPQAVCFKSKCKCLDEAFQFDNTTQICRHRCKTDSDCRHNMESINKTDIKYDYFQSRRRLVSMICLNNLCHCPQYSHQSMLNWVDKICLEDVQVEFVNLNFLAITLASLAFIIFIILMPFLIFIKKHLDFSPVTIIL